MFIIFLKYKEYREYREIRERIQNKEYRIKNTEKSKNRCAIVY